MILRHLGTGWREMIRSLAGARLTALPLIGLGLAGLTACTDSPGAAPQAASNVSPISGGCNVGPYVIPDGPSPTSATAVGTRVEDGKSGASVNCSVRRSGAGYSIRGGIRLGNSSFNVSGQVDQTADGVYSSPAGTSGSASFYHPDSDVITSETCTISVTATQQIGEGKVWGTATCTDSTQGSAAGVACDFNAAFVFENCDS